MSEIFTTNTEKAVNTLGAALSRLHNQVLYQTVLEGHSIQLMRPNELIARFNPQKSQKANYDLYCYVLGLATLKIQDAVRLLIQTDNRQNWQEMSINDRYSFLVDYYFPINETAPIAQLEASTPTKKLDPPAETKKRNRRQPPTPAAKPAVRNWLTRVFNRR